MITVPGSTETRTLSKIKRTYMRPRIVAFIPAHNEEKAIHDCLMGLKEQVLPSGVELDVFVVADNCTDRTEEIAQEAGVELGLSINIIVTENNKQRKVGALNAVWKNIYGDNMDIFEMERTDYEIAYQRSVKGILGMDADSRLAPRALQYLWDGLMSARNIGGVMAKYTMRMPKKKSLLSKDDPYYEEKLYSGEYGGPMARWWTHQQKQDMASWLLNLQYRGGSTYVLGGQATLFRPEALYEVMQSNKLDGPWQNDSDVEDMLLTWQLQKNGWKTLVSPRARCFVDAMRSYHTFRNQRVKWSSGTVSLLTDRDLMLKTRHTGHLWRSQMKSLMDLLIRVIFVLMLGSAIATDQFQWSWIWVIPIGLASLLNAILALKTPMHRPIDVILAFLLISPEIYLWVNLMTFAQVWGEKLSNDKKDGWANQYQAEAGKTKSKLVQGVLALLLVISLVIFACYYFRDYLTSEAVQEATSPYLMAGWIGLTGLTILMSLIMVYQIWTLRGRHQA